MSRKTAIQVGIIVVMLGGAVFVLYRGFGSSDTPTTTPAASTAPAAGGTPLLSTGTTLPAATSVDSGPTADPTKILPFGSKFDIGLVKKYNPDANTNNYPKVDPSTELEPPLNDLVKKNQ